MMHKPTQTQKEVQKEKQEERQGKAQRKEQKSPLPKKLEKLERTLGGLKFAVTILLIFALFMVIGTFCESYYGTDFANRVVYKTWYFMLLQFLMFLSIIFAAFLRLPPKKRLYGFYTIHTGLIIIGAGSFITYYAGIDGQITLAPNSPTRDVILPNDVLQMQFKSDGQNVTYKLPHGAFATNINKEYKDIKIGRYLPFADKKFEWKSPREENLLFGATHSTRYLLHNEMVSQEVTMSLHPEAMDFDSNATLGPLRIHYLPSALSPCFGLNNPSRIIIWDTREQRCFSPEEKKISLQRTKEGSRFLVYKRDGLLLTFFPDLSPWPFNEKMQVKRGGNLRVFSKKIFEKHPNLFLFGQSVAFFDKEKKTWSLRQLKGRDSSAELPWMGFDISIIEHREREVPTLTPVETLPLQKNNQLLKGKIRALQINVRGKNYWLTNRSPLQLMIDSQRVLFLLKKEELRLPFELILERFKMEKDPGTNRPASYESFIRLFEGTKGMSKHHIYMNHPLKRGGFTFYQASYSQNRQGDYISTLSVNVDPGRPFKYAGSLMLVFGSIAHYLLNHRRKKKKKITPLIGGIDPQHRSNKI